MVGESRRGSGRAIRRPAPGAALEFLQLTAQASHFLLGLPGAVLGLLGAFAGCRQPGARCGVPQSERVAVRFEVQARLVAGQAVVEQGDGLIRPFTRFGAPGSAASGSRRSVEDEVSL